MKVIKLAGGNSCFPIEYEKVKVLGTASRLTYAIGFILIVTFSHFIARGIWFDSTPGSFTMLMISILVIAVMGCFVTFVIGEMVKIDAYRIVLCRLDNNTESTDIEETFVTKTKDYTKNRESIEKCVHDLEIIAIKTMNTDAEENRIFEGL